MGLVNKHSLEFTRSLSLGEILLAIDDYICPEFACDSILHAYNYHWLYCTLFLLKVY